jgi:hypothetical protein
MIKGDTRNGVAMERVVLRSPVPSFSKILRSVVTIEMAFSTRLSRGEG